MGQPGVYFACSCSVPRVMVIVSDLLGRGTLKASILIYTEAENGQRDLLHSFNKQNG